MIQDISKQRESEDTAACRVQLFLEKLIYKNRA